VCIESFFECISCVMKDKHSHPSHLHNAALAPEFLSIPFARPSIHNQYNMKVSTDVLNGETCAVAFRCNIVQID
jgi:hypothetical protein